MPDCVSPLILRITEIRESRFSNITDAEAVREGFADHAAFMAYFATLHPGPVDLALPVWVVSFEVVT